MSDYLPEAVELMQRTIGHNGSANLDAGLLDWNNIPAPLKADVLLLSDVNYAPSVFEKVAEVISRFLDDGSTVILSTPQRLMAKPFIEQLLPFRWQQEEVIVNRNDKQLPVSVLVLRK
jgi:predicted nicotinamide N-methyase